MMRIINLFCYIYVLTDLSLSFIKGYRKGKRNAQSQPPAPTRGTKGTWREVFDLDPREYEVTDHKKEKTKK